MRKSNTKDLLFVLLVPVTGMLSCGTAYVFMQVLLNFSGMIHAVPFYYFMLPVGLYISHQIVQASHNDGLQHEKIMDMLYFSRGNVPLHTLPYRLGAFIVTVIAGGSVGKAGPSAQIGAGISNIVLKWKPGYFSPFQQEVLILCGISGGFTAVFGTPLFGAVFANKILWTHHETYKRLLPSLIASYSGYLVMGILGASPIPVLHVNLPKFGFSMMIQLLVFGIFVAILAFFFIGLVRTVDVLFRNFAPTRRILLGSIVLILTISLSNTEQALGLSQDLLFRSLSGEALYQPVTFVKMLATSLTFASGGTGGILAPIFVIGSTAGNLFGQMIHLYPEMYAKIGMAGFFAATSNAPLAAIVLCLELFGLKTALAATFVVMITYNSVRAYSVFKTQVKKNHSIVIKKSTNET